MNKHVSGCGVTWRFLKLFTVLFAVSALASVAYGDTRQFDFHGKDSSAAATGDIDATFQITGEKAGSNIKVTAVEIVVIDGTPTATNLFAALGMYKLKPSSSKISFPFNGVPTQPTSFTISNGRDASVPGNVWKLDINGKNASLRTHGDAMDVSFKGTLSPKSETAAAEDAKTMYIVGAIIIFATLGTGIYLLENYRKRKERRRKRRRSLIVDKKNNKTVTANSTVTPPD